MGVSTGSTTATSSTIATSTDEYYVPIDPMDDLQCESCQ